MITITVEFIRAAACPRCEKGILKEVRDVDGNLKPYLLCPDCKAGVFVKTRIAKAEVKP